MATTIQNIELPKKPRARDTSGNNNHGEIYSGRGLEFDGVTDLLTVSTDVSVAMPHLTQAGTFTVACWINMASITDAPIWQLTNNTSGGYSTNRMGLTVGEVLGSGILGACFSKYTGGYTHAGNTTVNPLNINTWYRVICVMTSGSLEIYINSDLLTGTISSGDTDRLASVDSDEFVIGERNNVHFDGMVSDFQTWDKAWTAADVTYDYLNPESLALNASGSALTEGNLKLWYPMQDGHRGQQSYILDGANTGLGVEEVTNGDFATGDMTGWGVGLTGDGSDPSAVAITGGYGARILNGAASGISQMNSGTVAANMSYKLTYRIVSNLNGNSYLSLQGGSVGMGSISADVGTHSVYLDSATASGSFYIKRHSANTDIVITDISVKAINDKHHATTVFYGDELIPHTNDRTFAGASNWANAAGDNAFANYNETGSGQLTVTPDDVSDVQYAFLDGAIGDDWEASMIAGRTYRLTYDIHVSAFTKGTLSVGLSTDAVPAVMKATQSFTATNGSGNTHHFDFVYVAADHEMITIYAAANTVLTADFDNFSLKEVGVASGWTDADQQLHIPQTALQSYNELAWFGGFNDCNVLLGSEIDTGSSDWSMSFWLYEEENGYPYSWPIGKDGNKNILTKNDNVRKLHYRDGSGAGSYHLLADYEIPLGQWNHFVIAATGDNKMQGYVNGVKYTENSDMSTTQLVVLYFMEGYSGNHFAAGSIAEVAYYNTVLTDANALDLFNDGKAKSALEASGSAGLVNYWRNNGLSTWTDLKGSNNGTPNALVTETILIPEGVDTTRDAQGFLMNKKRSTGSLNMTTKQDPDPHVDLGGSTTIAAGTAGSFMMWLKPDEVTPANYFFGVDGSDYIKINSATQLIMVADGATAVTFTVATMVPKEWMHVALVKDTDNIWRVYIDGDLNGGARTTGTVNGARDTSAVAVTMDQAVASIMSVGSRVTGNTALDAGNFTVASIDSTYVFSISSAVAIADGITLSFNDVEDYDEPFDYRYIGAPYGFRGQIDNVLIYNAELSATEVLQNYNATKRDHAN